CESSGWRIPSGRSFAWRRSRAYPTGLLSTFPRLRRRWSRCSIWSTSSPTRPTTRRSVPRVLSGATWRRQPGHWCGNTHPAAHAVAPSSTEGSHMSGEVNSLIDLNDSDIEKIGQVVAVLNARREHYVILEAFRREAIERFEDIGFKVDVKTWETNIEGVVLFEIEIQDRL